MMLTDQLNQLLAALRIKIPDGLRSPLDLTPSLLLAILESLLATRLPISPELRHSKDHDSKMKIFLGVLETDVLRSDAMNLSTIDPRRLARGEWDEVTRVAEVLCWIGRTLGLIPDDSTQDTSPATTNTATRTNSGVSMAESATTVENDHEDSTSSARPRCIHEVPSPLVAISPTLHLNEMREDETSSRNILLSMDAKVSPAVRYEGLISPVDEDWEISSFESFHSIIVEERRSVKHNTLYDYPFEDQEQRTIALLKDRAILLTQIARFESTGD